MSLASYCKAGSRDVIPPNIPDTGISGHIFRGFSRLATPCESGSTSAPDGRKESSLEGWP